MGGRFAGTIRRDFCRTGYILFVVHSCDILPLTVLLSARVSTAGIGCDRVAECSLNCSFVKPVADPSAGVSHTVS